MNLDSWSVYFTRRRELSRSSPPFTSTLHHRSPVLPEWVREMVSQSGLRRRDPHVTKLSAVA
jgi:hypothetical protein